MKLLPVLVLIVVTSTFSIHANAQTQEVQLKDLGVTPAQNNSNVISEPMESKPASLSASPATQTINNALSPATSNGFGAKPIGSPVEGSKGGGAAATYNYGGDNKPKSGGAKASGQ